jgi:hypothetical protein
LVSKVTESLNDLLECALIGEVLFGGDFDEGSNEGSEERVLGQGGLDSVEVLLDTLHLDEGGVSDLGKENQGLVDGIDGLLVLSNLRLVLLSLLLTVKGLLIKRFSVHRNVLLQLVKQVNISLSGGDQNVVDQIISVEDVSVCILDFLFELGNISVVVIGSSLEVGMELVKLFIEFFNKLVNAIDKLVKDALGMEVNLGEAKDKVGPLRVLDLSNSLLVAVGPNAVLDVDTHHR